MAADQTWKIEAVTDIAGAWQQIEPLMLGLLAYHEPWDRRRLREDWAPRMRDFMASQGVTLLAWDGPGEAVGLLHGTVIRDFGIFDEVVGYIHNAFVRDPYRRNGAGTALLQRFEAWCRESGASEIRLDVLNGNRLGSGFWRKHGFEVQAQAMQKSLEASS